MVSRSRSMWKAYCSYYKMFSTSSGGEGLHFSLFESHVVPGDVCNAESWRMKRSRSYSEGVELNVGVNLHDGNAPVQPRANVPSMSHPQTSLSLASSDGRAGAGTDPGWVGNTQHRESASESASSRETWPTVRVLLQLSSTLIPNHVDSSQ